jgi:hypothetical protein
VLFQLRSSNVNNIRAAEDVNFLKCCAGMTSGGIAPILGFMNVRKLIQNVLQSGGTKALVVLSVCNHWGGNGFSSLVFHGGAYALTDSSERYKGLQYSS